MRPLEAYVSDVMAPARFSLTLMGVFGALALLPAAVGLYGLISYWVGQRTRELGIRMALGARRRDILGLVLRQGLVLTTAGAALGLAAAFAATRLLAGFLYGVSAADPLTYAAVTALLAAVSVLACLVPARRA